MFRAIESKIKQNVSSMTTKEKWFLGILAVIVFAGLGLVIGKMICCAMECLAGVLCAMGVLCLGYIIWMVWYIFSKPIERDIVLVKKSYWGYVVAFVVAIPIAVSAILLLCNYSVENICSNPDDNSVEQIVPTDSSKSNEECNEPLHMLWEVYYHYVDPGNQQDAQGMGDKVLLAILSLAGIFLFNGLLVTTLLEWVNQRKGKWSNGTIRYGVRHLHKGRFAVVIGANELASSVIHNLLQLKSKENTLDCLSDKENDYVILQTSSDVQKVRDILASHLPAEFIDRVIIYNALRDSENEIKELHLEDATEIYILGENTTIDGGETYHDAMNMRCLNLIAAYLKAIKEELATKEAKCKDEKKKAVFKYKRKVCRVLFEYQTTYSVFQFSDVSETVKETMVFIPFNRYESWARRVMMDNKAIALVDENNTKSNKQINYTPLDGFKGIKPENTQRVHFIVVGMSKMGVAMGIQALYQAHYPNYVRDNSLKSRITFIDANAKQEMDFFKGRYATLFELARHRYIDANKCPTSELNSDDAWVDPAAQSDYKWKHLSEGGKNFLDVEIEFVKGELESEGVREYLRKVTADEISKVTIAICLPLTHQSVAAALYMPSEVYKNVQEIWVYQREASDIITNINPLENHNDDVYECYKKLKPFGMIYGEYIDRRTYYLKALLVNGIYEINDIDNKMYFTKINLGDKDTYIDLRKSWKNLTVEKTWSNKYFVDTIYQKVRSTNLALSEVAAIIGYNNNEFFTGNWKENLENALAELSKPDEQDKKDCLAECEHNRWNVQQLLLGFRPADAEKFAELCKEQAKEKAEVSPIKDEIGVYVKDKNITDQLVELNKKIHYTNGDVKNKSFTSLLEFITKEKIIGIDERLLADIMTLAEKEKKIKDKQKTLKNKKADLKSPKNKIHCCICDFNHLETVDPGAKKYDEKLNKGIPIILKLVDGYHCSTQQ